MYTHTIAYTMIYYNITCTTLQSNVQLPSMLGRPFNHRLPDGVRTNVCFIEVP